VRQSHTAIRKEETHKAVCGTGTQDIGSDKNFHRLFRLGREERVNVFAVDETTVTIAGMQASFLFIAYEPHSRIEYLD
jgi:hypothetical protein